MFKENSFEQQASTEELAGGVSPEQELEGEKQRREWEERFEKRFREEITIAYEKIKRELAQEMEEINSAKIPEKPIDLEGVEEEVGDRWLTDEESKKEFGVRTDERIKAITGKEPIKTRQEAKPATPETEAETEAKPVTEEAEAETEAKPVTPETEAPATEETELEKLKKLGAKRAEYLPLLFVPDKIALLTAKASGRLAVKGGKWLAILGLAPGVAVEETIRMVPMGVIWKKIQKERQKDTSREISATEGALSVENLDEEVKKEMGERVDALKATNENLKKSIGKARKRIHEKGFLLKLVDRLQYGKQK